MESLASEEAVAEIRSEWKRLWRERFDDRVLAEGVACQDYSLLFVDRGTVVLATRNFRLITLREIFEQHKIENANRLVGPSPRVGGWAKFIRTSIATCNQQGRGRRGRRSRRYEPCVKRPQQLKKGGRGWLHV